MFLCPHCNKKGISFWDKAFHTLYSPGICKYCGEQSLYAIRSIDFTAMGVLTVHIAYNVPEDKTILWAYIAAGVFLVIRLTGKMRPRGG